MSEIDFLPAEFFIRRTSLRDQWYLLAIGAVSLLLLLGSMVNQSEHTASLRGQLVSLKKERDDVQALVAEAQQLEGRRRVLASEAEFYALLQAHASVSHLLMTVASSCPRQLSINAIRIKPDKTALANLKRTVLPEPSQAGGGGAIPDEILRISQIEQLFAERRDTPLALEITGVAESFGDVAELIDQLKKSQCFAQVTMDKDEEAKKDALREFRIQCRLEKAL
jgi:Tfp pilus assembly protein PilN